MLRKLMRNGRRFLRRLRTDWNFGRERRRRSRANKGRSTADVFAEIYAKNVWGGKPGELFSGIGSTGSVASEYVRVVNAFIAEHKIRSVLDIGCGDFAVGAEIQCEDYTGIDVVPMVVERNQARFGSERRRFICLDAAGDEPLPPADLCLVRQVFQHLSNAQIGRVLEKLRDFRFVIVTEHYPAERDFVAANLDKEHGPDTRAYFGSGVYLDQPPFGARTKLLLDCPGAPTAKGVHGRGSIKSFLVRL